MLIGYIRVSMQEQNEQRQVKTLQAAGVDKVFIDKCSGRNMARPELNNMLTFIRSGDTVLVDSISRLARSTKDFLTIFDQIITKGAEFKSIKEAIDTNSIAGRFILTVFAAFSELEVDYRKEAQAEGIAIAKAKGKYKGRQPIQVNQDLFNKTINDWQHGNITAVQAMKLTGLKANTFYRRVKEHTSTSIKYS
jgi:DNA invertase Pin-like site-specific DNA recombinase